MLARSSPLRVGTKGQFARKTAQNARWEAYLGNRAIETKNATGWVAWNFGSSDRIRTGVLRLESPPWSPSGLCHPHLLAHFKSDLPPNHAKSLFANSSRDSHSSRILRGCISSMAHPCTKHSCQILTRLGAQSTTPNERNAPPERWLPECTLLDARNTAAARRRQRESA